jgi:hypothetical protein
MGAFSVSKDGVGGADTFKYGLNMEMVWRNIYQISFLG